MGKLLVTNNPVLNMVVTYPRINSKHCIIQSISQIFILADKVNSETMILQCDDIDESCGLPGDEGYTGEKCGTIAEGIAKKVSLSEGAD